MSGYSRLARNTAARKALLRDLVTDLILNGKVETTLAKAKELKKLADKMITLGKQGTLAARRSAGTLVRPEKNAEGKYALSVLFDTLAPKYADRNGGYTRLIKSGVRRGDAAPLAVVMFVD